MCLRAVSRFLAAFFVSLLFMAAPLAITVGFIEPDRPGLYSQRVDIKADDVYIPDQGDSLAVLFTGLSRDSSPSCFVLVHSDPANSALWALIMPPDIIMEGRLGLTTLADAYRSAGASGAALALSRTADVYIHRSAAISAETFGRIADAAGAIEMMLPTGIDIPNAGAYIEAGRQRMNGARLIAMAEYEGYPGGEAQRLELIGEAAVSLSEKYFLGFGSPSGERLFMALIGALSDSNLSMADYEYRRLAFGQIHNSGELALRSKVVGWSDTEAGRFITDEGIKAIRAACYPL